MDNMKATDLRIGNIIYQGEQDGDAPITSYDLNKFYDKSIFFYTADFYEEFAPTPLNEEWLLRCGFIKKISPSKTYYTKGNYFYEDGRLCLDGGNENIWYVDAEVIYVHQLQNLYFALEGEELILNG